MNRLAAGAILDASALRALAGSIYARTVVDVAVRERRPLLIPATCLYRAALPDDHGAAADPADFDTTDFVVTPLSQEIVPALVAVAAAGGPIGIDICHAAWEAAATGYSVLTGDPGRYRPLAGRIDLDII